MMEGEDGGVGSPEKEEYESSAHSTPQGHRSFAEFAKDKLDSAGRELRRRLPMAGQLGAQLLHPRRLLLHSTPTQHTDVVLIFPKGIPDSMLLWLLQKLRGSRPRLRVCVRQHASSQCAAFYITADDEVLLQTAEEVHLPKLLKPEFGGGYKEFTVRDMHCFQKGTSTAELLNSQERGALVKHVLECARAEPGDEHCLEPALTLRPGQSIVPACVSRGVVASVFPLHDRNALDTLRRKWVNTLFSPQPLDEISEYFGVKIAMYFAWLGHYTRSLAVPAVVGFVFWIWLGTANEYWKDIAHVLFSLFNVLWACVYLETWKRYSNVLAYKWGTLDQRDELLVEPRPLFQGEMGTSAVTGRPEPQYAAWRRRVWRHGVSFPVMMVCLTFGAFATFALLRAQDWWESHIVLFTWIPRAILAIIIAVEEEVYSRIARKRPKAASITEPVVTTGSLQMLQDVSPTKPIRRKEATPGTPLSLLGVRGLRDEPLHRSAHCIPQPTQHRPLVNPTLQELSGSVSAGGSEPDLNAVPSAAPSIDVSASLISATSSEDDKPKDKGSRSRAKAALVKRVRSVAVFSLGLRKAREAAAASGEGKHAHTPHTPERISSLGLPAPMLGGELSLIPIEQLIQVEDVHKSRTSS